MFIALNGLKAFFVGMGFMVCNHINSKVQRIYNSKCHRELQKVGVDVLESEQS
jgi:hypothetical protein